MSKQNKQSDFADCFISKQEAIDAQEAYMADHPLDGYEDELALIDILRNLPSSQPEIIRCKDCKYMQEDKIFHQYWCKGNEVRLDHFCSYAERRQE